MTDDSGTATLAGMNGTHGAATNDPRVQKALRQANQAARGNTSLFATTTPKVM